MVASQQIAKEILPGYFPAEILMTDTKEKFIAKTAEDIPPGRTFKVLATRVDIPPTITIKFE
jgi:hypothetical protein